MPGRILLVTAVDETHRTLLLESQGYVVDVCHSNETLRCLRQLSYDVVLATTESDVEACIEICRVVKQEFPQVRVGIVARGSDIVPDQVWIDAVIWQEGSPARFIAAVKKLVEAGEQSHPASSAE